MNFDFNAFIESIGEKYAHALSRQEIIDLLDVAGSYDLDASASKTNRLILTKIQFEGQKSSGAPINFTQVLNSGITVWIADNLKGKSSLFKIIKFALTGADNIKPDISKWVANILLNFSINEIEYCIHLDRTKARLTASLYKANIASFNDLNSYGDDLKFQAKNATEYMREMQQFFFEQFEYYSLKWTQKSPQKDSTDLLEAGASWKTYFKSLYLESQDSASLMYGDQAKKIFQMLLGLDLTFPINRLSVKKDLLQNDFGKSISASTQLLREKSKENEDLLSRLKEINRWLADFENQNTSEIDITTLFREYDSMVARLNASNLQTLQNSNDSLQAKQDLQRLQAKLNLIQHDITNVTKESEKTSKNISSLEEFLEIGIFFSNLDIKHCPNCNHSVSGIKPQSDQNASTCFLCREHIDQDTIEVDQSAYIEKIARLKLENDKLETEREILAKDAELKRQEYARRADELVLIEGRVTFTPDTEPLKSRLLEIEKLINAEKKKVNPSLEERTKLVAEKAVIEFRLKIDDVGAAPNAGQIKTKIDLLQDAIEHLNNLRFSASVQILKQFSELMLSEIHEFGLTSISEVSISKSFDITYLQDGEFITFDQIAEGEQLRVKLAFYLSLIQLDIEHGFGRHIRLLIIDSPAKEEADKQYLNGLSDILRSIERRYGQDLQILIGTAERSLAGVASNEYVIPVDQYLF